MTSAEAKTATNAARADAALRLRVRSDRAQLLSEILAQLLGAADADTLVRELFATVAAHLAVDTYFNFMVDDTGGALRLHSCAGIPEEVAKSINRLEFGQAICGTVAEFRKAIVANNIQHTDYDKADLVRGFGIQTYACNPLMVGERLLGTLSFASRQRPSFDEEELGFIRTVSQYAAIALDRLRNAAQLRESEQLYKAIALENVRLYESVQKNADRLGLALTAADLGDWSWDAATDVMTMSSRALEIYGLPEGTKATRSWLRGLLDGEDAERARQTLAHAMETRTDYDIEYRVNRPAGGHRWVAAKGRSLYGPDSEVTGMLGVVQDITETKRAEEELRDARARVEATLASAEIGTWVWDIGNDRVLADKNLAKIFSLPAGTAAAPLKAFMAAIHPEDRERVENEIKAAIASASGELETDYRLAPTGGKTTRWVTARGKVERDAGGNAMLFPGVAIDITERKRQEQELEDLTRELANQSRLFDTTLSNIPDLAYAFDRDARFIYGNKPILDVLGITLDQLVGRSMQELNYPPDLVKVLNAKIAELVATGKPVRGETAFIAASGIADIHEYIFNPVFGADGKVASVAGVTRMVTERKKHEAMLREAKESAEAANRSKDRFLAVLSHELRTPLTPVLMTVEALETDRSLSPEVREDLAMIRRNVELETKLIDDLLDLSRITSGKLSLRIEAVDLNKTVQQACSICRPQILEKSIRLHCDLGGTVGNVMADSARLQQVLWNVLKNAAKFGTTGGDIHVTTSKSGNGRVQVSIRDTGIGVTPDSASRIFDAFEQGDAQIARQFGGLGLGLAISKALVELHHGTIRAESPGLGLGTTFIVELPGASSAPEHEETHPRVEETGAVPLRLLVVEDHPDTLRLLSRLLRADGYSVQTAGDVASALKLAAGGPFDLVISDVGLPDSSGYDLMKRIREDHPGMKGIAMSGYGMDEDIRKSMEAGFSEHLVKPIDIPRLEQAIRRVTGDG